MDSSLALQKSLFRHQAKQIAQQIEGTSSHFRQYQQCYLRATRHFRRAIDYSEVETRVQSADLVYVGDYHTLPRAQAAYCQLVASALHTQRRVILALEFVESQHQKAIQRFLRGDLSEQRFLKSIGRSPRGPFDLWRGFAPIFKLAQEHRLEVIGVDHRRPGRHSLSRRDQAAAQLLATTAAAADRPLVLVLMGQFHVAPKHLPLEVKRHLKGVARNELIIYQNAEHLYWTLAAQRRVESTRAVELSDRELCLMHTPPVVCQRSFLDYVEAEAADEALDYTQAEHTFRHLVRNLGRVLGVSVEKQLRELLILSPEDLDATTLLQQRSALSAPALARLQRQLVRRQVAWIPSARVLWLSSNSLNHLAEAAAHCVRSAASTSAERSSMHRSERFWKHVYETACGFFGSRLINPKRRSRPLEEWAWHFQHRRGALGRQAAYILALDEALQQPTAPSNSLLPPQPALAHDVSEAIGARIGDTLAQAFFEQRVSITQAKALFAASLHAPAQAVFDMARLQFGCR